MQLPRPLRVRLKRFAYGGVGGSAEGERVVARLGLRPGMRVADIGSGFGEFAVRFAGAVGRDGEVFAVDTDADLRDEVAATARRLGLLQLSTVAARADDPSLPGPVDLAFLSSSYHHLPDGGSYVERLRPHLAPGGRIAILEPQPSLLTGWFGHSTPPERIRATLEAAGYDFVERADIVRWAPLQVFAVRR